MGRSPRAARTSRSTPDRPRLPCSSGTPARPLETPSTMPCTATPRSPVPAGRRPQVATSRPSDRACGGDRSPLLPLVASGCSVASPPARTAPAAATPAPRPPSVSAYWVVASDGGIFSFGGAPLLRVDGGHPSEPAHGGHGRHAPTAPGYWLVASDGGIFAFGDAAVLRVHRGHAPQPAGRGHGRRPRQRRGTGWWPPTAGSSPSATPRSTGRWAASTSTSPSSAWPPPRTGAATGWSPPTAGSSPSATPASTGRPGTSG